ncbi:EamA family transporter [Achromobacter aloeverae]|uniref:EamA family transporter n=1 Tax=Achromobacter aloeverae TaxID=1750518 RepID=A0A4V1MRU9_9BURK|nr:DMT family transporter [Achromobacter aloeverae]RXN86311.1 EamA family transporter [Achromobacter aloeverae]
MVGVTMIWGVTFLTVQHALSYSSPLFFVGCRFAAAALAVGLVSRHALRSIAWRDVRAGAVIGACIVTGYGLQTMGLQHVASSESGFLTALYVPLVPLLQWVFWRRPPHIMCLAGVACAFAGMLCFADGGQGLALSFTTGQTLTLVAAVAFALEICAIGHYAARVNVRCVTVAQLAFTALFAFALRPLVGEHETPALSWELAAFAGGMGCASALIQVAMNWAQKTVDASRAAIIYAGEPIWAGLFGRLAGERLPGLALIGGALIVLAILVSEWRPRRLRARGT